MPRRCLIVAEAVAVGCPYCGDLQPNADGSEMWLRSDFDRPGERGGPPHRPQKGHFWDSSSPMTFFLAKRDEKNPISTLTAVVSAPAFCTAYWIAAPMSSRRPLPASGPPSWIGITRLL